MEPIFIGRVRMQMDEGGGSDREAEEPKLAAGYYWIKHINGDTDLSEAAKQKADKYNMTELITRGIEFCTICGDEEHWAYVCPEFPVAYKRPVLKKKRRNPEEYWQQKDEDLLHENCITEREIVQYLMQFSPKKNIHRALVEQDREIQNFVSLGHSTDFVSLVVIMNQRIVMPVQCVLNSGRNVMLNAACAVGFVAWLMTTGL
ncbi:hypothetical protein M0R45_010417 [Rubus argutus]|uniref:Uncharacterized protein n=1 Tax=Rubus argutus TaxID=59490 RepID=A0AAW1Y703_RUBAR